MNALVEAADSARKSERYLEALSLYQECLKISPQDADVLAATAYCLYHLHRTAEARDANQAAVHVTRNLLLAHVVEAFLASDDGNPARAVQEAEVALRLGPSSAEALACRGILALEEGNPAEARTYLERAIGSNPLMYLAHYNLIGCYQRLGDAHAASAQIRAIFRLKPNVRNLLRLLVSIVMGSRVVFATFMLAPLLVLIIHAKILFAFHVFLIALYVGSALLAITERQPALVRRNFMMVAIIAIIDVLILAIST